MQIFPLSPQLQSLSFFLLPTFLYLACFIPFQIKSWTILSSTQPISVTYPSLRISAWSATTSHSTSPTHPPKPLPPEAYKLLGDKRASWGSSPPRDTITWELTTTI